MIVKYDEWPWPFIEIKKKSESANGHSLSYWPFVGPNSILQTFDFSQLVFAVRFDFSVVVAVLLQLACFDSFVVAVVVLALPMDLVFAAGVLAFYLADLDPVTEAGFPFL